MHDFSVIWLFVAMAGATIFTRISPLLLSQVSFSPFVQRWLTGVPYTILALLIFPGIFEVDGILLGFLATSLVILLSLLRMAIHWVILIVVLSFSLYYFFFVPS